MPPVCDHQRGRKAVFLCFDTPEEDGDQICYDLVGALTMICQQTIYFTTLPRHQRSSDFAILGPRDTVIGR